MEIQNSEGQLVLFAVDGENYGIRVSQVAEIIRMVEIDSLPGSPPWMTGVVNLRGAIIPIVDLRLRLGHDHTPIDLTTPIIITRGDSQNKIGLLVDLVADMDSFNSSEMDSSGKTGDLDGLAKIDGTIYRILRLEHIVEEAQRVLHA